MLSLGEAASSVKIGDIVTVSYRQPLAAAVFSGGGGGGGSDAHVLVEWEGGRVGDTVADAVVVVLLQVCTSHLELCWK